MRVEEVLKSELKGSAIGTPMPPSQGGTDGEKRNAAHPEVAQLLKARKANRLLDGQSLARDEIELANFIINKLDGNPSYEPSETLLQAIRAITDKLSGKSSMYGVIRTA